MLRKALHGHHAIHNTQGRRDAYDQRVFISIRRARTHSHLPHTLTAYSLTHALTYSCTHLLTHSLLLALGYSRTHLGGQDDDRRTPYSDVLTLKLDTANSESKEWFSADIAPLDKQQDFDYEHYGRVFDMQSMVGGSVGTRLCIRLSLTLSLTHLLSLLSLVMPVR